MLNNDTDSREFDPEQVEAALAAFDRRAFLKLMGASIAAAGAAGLGACSKPQPPEKIVPYVRSPEDVIPGRPAFYASALGTSGFGSGFGRGVIVESHEGRPTKIEGNPLHASSLGATDIFMQAAVLQLYDPDRSKVVLGRGGPPASWGQLLRALEEIVRARDGAGKVRVRLLTRTLTSPTVLGQIEKLKGIFPRLVWHVDDTPGVLNGREGQRRALGQAVTVVHDFGKAKRIVSLDGHFLGPGTEGAGTLRDARAFAQHRRMALHGFGPNNILRGKELAGRMTVETMSRLYVAESTITYTGMMADHRVAVRPTEMARVATALGQGVLGGAEVGGLSGPVKAWVEAAVRDLKGRPGESLVIVGEYQPAEVHALGHAMNAAIGAVGNTLRYVQAVDGVGESIEALVGAMETGEVDLLVMMDVNPVFTSPGDVEFGEAMRRFSREGKGRSVHVGAMMDETGVKADWHVPLSHPLESWGDLRGHDGTASVVQPLIEPLWQSKSMAEVLAGLMAVSGVGKEVSEVGVATGYELVRGHWFGEWKERDPAAKELRWRKSLRDGVIEGTEAAGVEVGAPDGGKLLDELVGSLRPAENGIELAIRLDPSIGDGEAGWANHPWLQELPKPLTHLTWENVALIGPGTAAELGIREMEHFSRGTVPVLRVSVDKRTIEIPVWVQPGHPEKTVTLHVGYGHKMGGEIQGGIGVNVYPLRALKERWHRAGGVRVELTGKRADVACTQATQYMADREVARSRPVGQVKEKGGETPDLYSSRKEAGGKPGGKSVHLSLYDEYRYAGYKWGMVIDLSACIGCNACVIACQSENNIPVVGKDQVRRGREMHWIRIDTYYGGVAAGSLAEAERLGVGGRLDLRLQPMLCQHCENAPCEVVCPVEATSHSAEGINEMTYNRCVGTRYCSNNCPYKVRRFNFLAYSHGASTGMPDDAAALAAMQKNPNVTVRGRGVMEKCNYCIQRINRARIDAKRDWSRSEAPESATAAPAMRVPVTDGWLEGGKAKALPRLLVQTACQQACPTEAIVFGDLNDAGALVTQLKGEQPWAGIDYGVLTELNTQPRTSYLERLTNANPTLDAAKGGAA